MVHPDYVLSEDAALHLLDCNSHIIVKIMELRERAAAPSTPDHLRQELELQSDQLQERLAENLLILARNETLISA